MQRLWWNWIAFRNTRGSFQVWGRASTLLKILSSLVDLRTNWFKFLVLPWGRDNAVQTNQILCNLVVCDLLGDFLRDLNLIFPHIDLKFVVPHPIAPNLLVTRFSPRVNGCQYLLGISAFSLIKLWAIILFHRNISFLTFLLVIVVRQVVFSGWSSRRVAVAKELPRQSRSIMPFNASNRFLTFKKSRHYSPLLTISLVLKFYLWALLVFLNEISMMFEHQLLFEILKLFHRLVILLNKGLQRLLEILELWFIFGIAYYLVLLVLDLLIFFVRQVSVGLQELDQSCLIFSVALNLLFAFEFQLWVLMLGDEVALKFQK